MKNSNLEKGVKFGDGTRTHEEEQELRRKGAYASHKARTQKKNLKKIAQAIGEGKVTNPKNIKQLEGLGLDTEELTNNSLAVASLYKAVLGGNVNAYEKWEEYHAEDATEEREYKLPAEMLGKDYVDINRHIEPNVSYIFKGGRGSLKSSYVALKIIELLINNPQMHCCVVRKVAGTLRDSVYAQIIWAIDILNLTEKFKCTISPLEIVYKPTGQRIFFRGVDKPEKLKSITTPFGYIGILWREERDQLSGIEEERSIKQSVLRGGDITFDFATYNPPISKAHWVNIDSETNKSTNIVYHTSNYQNAPREWLGTKFIQEAEYLKEVNERAYLHEYMGVPIGNGTNVFENVEVRKITDEDTFDYIYMGIDWGYNPDPFRWVKVGYRDETVYILDEYSANKKSNKEVWQILQDEKNVTEYDYITADSAEPKSIDDLRTYGANIRKAEKGQGSVHYGIKWLQTRKQIVISEDCPITAKEFLNYEYEKTKDGEPISAYPDKDNHSIDAVRYALERVWRKRGQ